VTFYLRVQLASGKLPGHLPTSIAGVPSATEGRLVFREDSVDDW